MAHREIKRMRRAPSAEAVNQHLRIQGYRSRKLGRTKPLPDLDHATCSSCAAHGLDQRGAAAVDLAAQPTDVRLDDVGLRIEMVFPHLFEQHLARDKPALGAHQEFEQAELARLEVDRVYAAAHGARD